MVAQPADSFWTKKGLDTVIEIEDDQDQRCNGATQKGLEKDMSDILDELKELKSEADKLDKPNKSAAVTKPSVAKKPAKKQPKADKPKAGEKRPKAEKEPKAKKERKVKRSATRTNDRDRKGDGLREFERKLIKVVEKHGPISIKNLAEKMFGKNVPGEADGKDSVRTIRNAVRKPVQYGLLQRPENGQIEVTNAYKKSGLTVAEKSVATAREARKADRPAKTPAKKVEAKKVAKKAVKKGKRSK